jgi:hypothetical protein
MVRNVEKKRYTSHATKASQSEECVMPKIRKSTSELIELALAEIRTYRGCHGVGDVAVHPILDDRAGCNWSIMVVDLGTAERDLARRAAIETQERLSAQFDLFEEPAASEPSAHRGARY